MTTLANDAALTAWADLMQFTDDDITEMATAVWLPVNADGFTCWAVTHRQGAAVPVGVPQPTYRITEGGLSQSVWFLKVPVRTDQTKPVNAWKMTMAMLCAALGGREETSVANPLTAPEAVEWSGATTDITTMKAALGRAGYLKNRFYNEARSNGGAAMTEKQTAARRVNLVAAREEAKRLQAERAANRARDLVAMAETGASDADIADAFHLALGSVKTSLTRARQRIGWQPPEPPPRVEEPRVSLDELVDMLTAEAR